MNQPTIDRTRTIFGSLTARAAMAATPHTGRISTFTARLPSLFFS